MDTGLQKINELKKKLEQLYIEKDDIEEKINFNNKNKKHYSFVYDKLIRNESKLKHKKAKIKYKQSNLKKWKINTIIITIIAILILEGITSLGSFFNVDPINAVKLIAIFNPIIITMGIMFGNITPYYSSKKYLKQNKIEDVENELNENSKKIKINRKYIEELNEELNNLLTIKGELLSNIDLLENEINNITTIRTNIINEYLNNNLEFDNLFETEYNSTKQKKLNKEE